MTVSELEALLREFRELHGDKKVMTRRDSWSGPFVPVTLCDVGILTDPKVPQAECLICHIE